MPNLNFHYNFRVVINHDEQSATIHMVEYRDNRIIGFDPEPFSPLGSDSKWNRRRSPTHAIKELKNEINHMRRAFKLPPLDYKKLVAINHRADAKPIPVIDLTPEDEEAISTNIYLCKD